MREMTLQADPPTSMQPKLATRQLIDISFGLLGVLCRAVTKQAIGLPVMC